MFWPAPAVDKDVDDAPDRGPVMITVEYEIDPQNESGFLTAVRTLSGERYRDGAYQWGVYQDAGAPSRWVEWFLLPSWAEHLRQHERVTESDRDIQLAVRRFHVGQEPPKVDHWLAPAGPDV